MPIDLASDPPRRAAIRATAALALLVAAAIGPAPGCGPTPQATTTPAPTDTDSAEPQILPIDTANFIPRESGVGGPPDIAPSHYVYMSQVGLWNLSSATNPTDMFGNLQITEYVDTLDTALPVYECNVTYSLTGSSVNNNTCPDCAFVMDVEYYVNLGDPGGCHDPDTPQTGDVWQLGWSQTDATLYLNYYGTDVWLPWYPGVKNGSTIDFSWSATLAIEVMDSGMGQ